MRSRIQLLASLDFPSDRLTVGALRRRFPHAFDQAVEDALTVCPFISDDHHAGFVVRDRLGSLLDAERQVALNALVDAQGLTRPDWYQSPEEERETVIELYQEYGIAEGPEHAKQLLRGLESAAASLAKGRSRG